MTSDSGVVTTCSGHRDQPIRGFWVMRVFLNHAVVCLAFWSLHVTAFNEHANDQECSLSIALSGLLTAPDCHGIRHLKGSGRQVPPARQSGGSGLIDNRAIIRSGTRAPAHPVKGSWQPCSARLWQSSSRTDSQRRDLAVALAGVSG